MTTVSRIRRACSNLGIFATLLYLYKTKVLDKIYSTRNRIDNSYKIGTLRAKQLLHPVVFRYNSSDVPVFRQIFISEEYKRLTTLREVKLIIDCGANVGYSSVYFLSKFPDAHVIAVEPDRSNYELLMRNVSVYGDRVTAICSAVWSHKAALKVCAGHVGDKREWATTVRECIGDEEADLEGLDIAFLLNQSLFPKIDILKVDIEGAERVVFNQEFKGWINKVRTIAIELHGKECQEIFYRAISEGSFDVSRSGENTIAQRH